MKKASLRCAIVSSALLKMHNRLDPKFFLGISTEAKREALEKRKERHTAEALSIQKKETEISAEEKTIADNQGKWQADGLIYPIR